jgi:hypothetical protein
VIIARLGIVSRFNNMVSRFSNVVSRFSNVVSRFSNIVSRFSNLSCGVCPPGFSGRLIREGAGARASLLFSATINTALPPSASFSNFLLPVPGFLARPNSRAARSLPPGVPGPSLGPFGLAAAEDREGFCQ